LRKFLHILNIVIAIAMFTGGITGAILTLFRIIGKNEPQLVLQLSWAALWYSGYTMINVIVGNDNG
jgi:hypothetical protein